MVPEIKENLNIHAKYVLARIHCFEETFCETGSHYFGNVTKRSDYDLMAEYTEDLVKKLQLLGFKNVDKLYGDRSIYLVMNHHSGIDIQLLIAGYLDIKKKAQKLLNSDLHFVYCACKESKDNFAIMQLWDYIMAQIKIKEDASKNLVFGCSQVQGGIFGGLTYPKV